MRTDSSETRLEFGKGMARCWAFFLPIWFMALSFPFVHGYSRVSGVLFTIGGLLAMLPYLRNRVTFLTWWLLGLLIPVAVMWLGAWALRMLGR